MQQFAGKIAVITGASSGIGAALAKALAEAGMTVVGLARRKEKLEELAETLRKTGGKLYTLKADVTKEEELVAAFKWIDDNLKGIHVLVNSAGIVAITDLIEGDAKLWKDVLDINVHGLAMATKEAIKIMRTNNIDGHIINMNSVAGHKVVAEMNMYSASKYAVTALTETIRLELHRLGSKIKITSISPGLTNTNIFDAAGATIEAVQDCFKVKSILNTEDIVNVIKFVICTPPHVLISEVIMRPVGEKL